MLFPVRCFTCGAPISRFWNRYKELVIEKKEPPGKVLDLLGIKRYCCRRMFLSYPYEILEEVIQIEIQKANIRKEYSPTRPLR
ncbi:MAG: DNA-directed RNA polymerase subunit N [Candidatus Korarchaeota archaeon]